ncbi:MAG TPA: hypothetical protein VFQ53_42550 [Kofleriaceae bacterium]|nr:hypothetical protein [Kofleriaceae bacterium]
MRRISSIISTALLALAIASAPASAKGGTKAAAPAKKPAAAKKEKAPPPKKVVMVTGEKKKALAELFAGFKFGMSKDDVVKQLGKQLDERYEEKIKATTDIALQDRLRKEKKTELARISQSYISFEGKKTGWDVSIIEDEFAHNTGESMLERWENKDGKNQRRFFFFKDGKLWKMFVSLDVSILPEDKQNFETFKSVMQAKYGPGAVDTSTITWTADDFEARAVDKLKSYAALGLVIEDRKVKKELIALRESKAEKKPETSAVIKAVIDTDKTDKPDVKANSNAVDDVIKAQGTAPPPKK